MFRFTIRDVASVLAAALLVVLALAALVAFSWNRGRPRSKLQQVRRDLEKIQFHTEQRNRGMKELSGQTDER